MPRKASAAMRPEEIGGLGREVSPLVAGLETCLSNSFVLMMKSQACHWNVTGPLFSSIHALTQVHYEDLFTAIDDIAERVRALDHPAPKSLADMIGMATITELPGPQSTEAMVAALQKDHHSVAKQMRSVVQTAETASDSVSADLMTARIAFHEKAAWMLGAILSK